MEELAFLDQAAYEDNQEKMDETRAEDHLNQKAQERHLVGENPLEQKVPATVAEKEAMLEKMALDLHKVELTVVAWVEHVEEVLELLWKTAVLENAGKVHRVAGHWMLGEEEEALMGH